MTNSVTVKFEILSFCLLALERNKRNHIRCSSLNHRTRWSWNTCKKKLFYTHYSLNVEHGRACHISSHRSSKLLFFKIEHTFPISLLLALSLLTWDSAMSARSWASSSSCWTFLNLDKWVLACSSFNSGVKSNKMHLLSPLLFFF